LFVAAERERHPTRRAQILRALLDEARQAGFYVYVLALAAPLAESIPKGGELGWFAETGIETALVSGNHADVRAWVAVAGGGRRGGRFDHWLALSDILDTALRRQRVVYLPAVELMAVHGLIGDLILHRL